MPKKPLSKIMKAKKVLRAEITDSKTKLPKEAKKIYAIAIGALVVIAFAAGWFAFRTIFPKIVKAPTSEPSRREMVPSEESLDLEIKKEEPIESFEDVDEALEDLESRVREIGELDSDLELPDIDLDSLGL